MLEVVIMGKSNLSCFRTQFFAIMVNFHHYQKQSDAHIPLLATRTSINVVVAQCTVGKFGNLLLLHTYAAAYFI